MIPGRDADNPHTIAAIMTRPASLTRREAALLRITNQFLAHPPAHSPAQIVAWMGAIQGQDFKASSQAIALRGAGLDSSAVDQAYRDRTIVRTWPMRGTLHVVPAEDAGWMVRLLAHRSLKAAKTRHAQLGLDDATVARAMQVFEDQLGAGGEKTRPDLFASLSQSGIDPTQQRGVHLIGIAAQTGLVVGTGFRDRQPTFAWSESWITRPATLDTDEAWSELAWRYIQSHGPVTERDFAWWTGSTLTAARSAFASHESKLMTAVVDQVAYVAAADRATPDARAHREILAPAFDEIFLGYQSRDLLLDRELHRLVVPGKNGVFLPIVVSDGRVDGTWSARPPGDRIEIIRFPQRLENGSRE